MTKSFSIFIMISDCTLLRGSLATSINSLLSSVEFSLVFVLPLKMIFEFLFTFALRGYGCVGKLGGVLVCLFFFEANEMWKPLLTPAGVCAIML